MYLIIFIVALAASLLYYFSYRRNLPISEQTVTQSAVVNPTTTPQSISADEYWKVTKTYHNSKYQYSFAYSSREDLIEETPEKIVFGDAQLGVGFISVVVELTHFLNPDEWLNQKNDEFRKRFESGGGVLASQFLEKRIKIDGYDALITHQGDTVEQFPGEKETVFVKNHYLYIIYTSYISEPERLWSSFKFEK